MSNEFIKEFLDQVSKQWRPMRRLVLLKPGEKAPKSLSEVPEGMREETDAEYAARIRVDPGGL